MQEALSFDAIRVWDGSQSRAFEELAFQLLKDTVPTGTRAIRTGNPDGGVEWYAVRPDGTEVGWQAKHTHGIKSLLSGMTESVKAVLRERPNLRELTFVISDNLSTGTSGNERKSSRQKYEDKVATWQRELNGAADIKFELIQGSDLLALLAQPKHQARVWFWWGGTVLDQTWLRGHQQEQADAAGKKYRPELQVDIPIQADLVALGFGRPAQRDFARLVKNITDAVAELRIRAQGNEAQRDLYDQIQQSATTLAAAAQRLSIEAQDRTHALDDFLSLARACQEAIDAGRSQEIEMERQKEELAADDPASSTPGHSYIARSRSVGELDDAIYQLIQWLKSSQGRAFLSNLFFLSGQAGSGKTHLFLDATKRALDEGRPAVFLAGAQLGKSDLWGSITDQLGLAGIGRDMLLDAMDSAAEASSLTGHRFVIFIDALNETLDDTFWHTHLPSLRAAVARRPHLALAVSCRDTYLPVVAEEEERNHFVFREHPGFAEREDEAAAMYFVHYGLEAPRIPLLTPEFTLPLFLRIYCESLSEENRPAVGHESRTRTFERYLRVKVKSVARRLTSGVQGALQLQAAQQNTADVLDRLVDELAVQGKETLRLPAMLAIVQQRLGCDEERAVRVVAALQDEGVLTSERLYLGQDSSEEGVRIVFQAFSDFLILRRRLAATQDPLTDQAFRDWLLDDASLGIIEAASIAVPELYGRELVDILGLDAEKVARQVSRAGWRRPNRVRWIFDRSLASLPYRSADSITRQTVDLINAASRFVDARELFHVLLLIAPQPDNDLNGDRLHENLARLQMPDRDRWFGFATYDEVFEPGSAASRLARWAARGPYPSYRAEVLELAAIPLCWLFSSPNRYQRDWITKALSELLRGHLDVAAKLVQRFSTVNDPYVVQRVIVTAYGALLKSDEPESDGARSLAETVLDSVFTGTVAPDTVLLDAARGIVRFAVAHGLLPADALETSQGPYGIAAPRKNPPTEATLKAKYGTWDAPEEQNYSSVYGSIYGMGDFGRYVIEPVAHRFTPYPLSAPVPDTEKEQPSNQPGSRSKKSATAELEAILVEYQATDEGSGNTARKLAARRNATEQLRRETGKERNRHIMRGEFPPGLAKRWVMARVISLGWSPEHFGKRDLAIARRRSGREAHKAERWGKKYQWIAYHELTARLADNFHPSRWSELYSRSRDIDPSLPPIPFEEFAGEHTETDRAEWRWGPPEHRLVAWPPSALDFDRYGGDISTFLADTSSEPHAKSLTQVVDEVGTVWIILQGNISQTDPKAIRGWRGLQQRASINSWLVPAGSGAALATALSANAHHGTSDFEDRNGHEGCCFIGEIGRSGPSCYHRNDKIRTTAIDKHNYQAVRTTEEYVWPGSGLDCSDNSPTHATLPSAFMQAASPVKFNSNGPTWLDSAGVIAYQNYWEPEKSGDALIARAAHLTEILVQAELELVISAQFERMTLGGSGPTLRHSQPYKSVSEFAWLDSSLTYKSAPIRTEIGQVETED